MGGRLILVCGLPGSGKTTVAEQLEAAGALRLAPDEWMVGLGRDLHDLATRRQVIELHWDLAQQVLLRGLTVVDENGSWQRTERDRRRAWARANGVAIELRVLDPPLDVLRERITLRNRSLPPGWSPVDPDDLAEWDAVIERPDAEELALYDAPIS